MKSNDIPVLLNVNFLSIKGPPLVFVLFQEVGRCTSLSPSVWVQSGERSDTVGSARV